MLIKFNQLYPEFFKPFSSFDYSRKLIEEKREHKIIFINDEKFGKIKIAKPRNPLRDARLDLKRCLIGNGELTIIGFGLGFHIKILLDEYNISNLEIIILNPDIFQWALENIIGIEKIINDKRVVFKPLDFTTMNSNLKTNLYIHKESALLFPNEKIRISLLQIRLQHEGGSGRLAVPDFHEKENLKNIANYNPVKKLFNTQNNKTAYILGGGPSLNDYIPFFKNSSKDSIIIACNAVLKNLIKNKINFDYITYIEMQNKTITDFDGVFALEKPLITYVHSHSEVVSKSKKVYLAYHKHSEKQELDLGTLHSNGNVIHLSTTLAIKMGCSKIIFCGVDLGFDDKNKYCSNAPKNRRTDNDVKVNGIANKQIYTSLAFYTAKKYLEKIISDNKHIKFYNMGKIGAIIDGTNEFSTPNL